MGRRKITKRITACMLAILLACSSIPMESFRVMAATEDISDIPSETEELLQFGSFGENDEFTWEFYGGTNRLCINGTGDMPDLENCGPWLIEPPNDDAILDMYMEMGGYPDTDAPENGNELENSDIEVQDEYVQPWDAVRDQVEQIDIDPNITSIGDGAFQNFKRLVSVKIPNITSIGNEAFSGCDALKSLTFGDALEVIEHRAFMRLGQGMLEVHFQGNAPQMAENVFVETTATVYYTAEDESWQDLVGNNYGGTLDWQPTELIESGTFGDGFTWAFYKGMDRLYINGTGDMPDFAFCDPDTDFEMPDADKEAFLSDSDDELLQGMDMGAYLDMNEADGTKLADGQRANESAHSDGRPWASVSGQVKEIFLSKAITSIGSAAFQDFKQLELVYMPSVTSVGEGAFCCCESLKSLTFGKAFQKIGDKAFSRSGLTEIHFQGSAPQISEDPFYHVTATVYYPASNASWQSLIGENFGGVLIWQSVADRKECLAGGRIGEDLGLTWTFYDSGRLVISGAGKIPDYYPPLTFIPEEEGEEEDPIDPGKDPGSGEEPGESISEPPVIPENPAQPVRNRPWELYKLRIKKVELSEGITGIGEKTFVDAAALAEVSLPESLADISAYAFANCESLANITIPSGVYSIGYWAFGLAGLKTIYFAGDAPDINGKAFHEVTADVYYPQNSTGWEEITGQDFGGRLTWHNTDQKKDLSSCSAELSQSEYTYDGTEKKPDVTVMDKSKELKKETDYTVKYSDNVNAGTATVVIAGKGNYEGTITKTFAITQADPILSFAEEHITKKYSDSSFTNELTKITDGAVVYSSSNRDVAEVSSETGAVTIKGSGTTIITAAAETGRNYLSGEAAYTLIVQGTNVSWLDASLEYSDCVYDGTAKEPAVTLKDGSETLQNGVDYTVVYSNNIESGTASVKICGIGAYTGTGNLKFTISRRKPSLKFAKNSLVKTYGESAFTNKLSKMTDGKISFKSSNSKVATVNKTGKVTIKGVGKTKITASAAEGKNYSAKSVSYTLKVNPKGTSILKITSTKKGFTVKWKEQRKQTTGYQVQYAANSKFSGAKNVTLKNTTVSKKISKLKAKKKYFIRVRTYKIVSGEKYVSSWSKTKSVTTRK